MQIPNRRDSMWSPISQVTGHPNSFSTARSSEISARCSTYHLAFRIKGINWFSSIPSENAESNAAINSPNTAAVDEGIEYTCIARITTNLRSYGSGRRTKTSPVRE